MDIKSKKSDTEELNEGSNNEKKKNFGRFKAVLTSGMMRTLAFLLTCAMGVCILGWAFQHDENGNNSGYFFEDRYTSSEEFISSKNNLYQALCTTATVYLRNCKNGEFQGSEDLYKNFMRALKSYEYSNIINIYSNNRTPVIESSFFDYYVCFGNSVITNIEEMTGIIADQNDIKDFQKERSCWYTRYKNTAENDENYQSNDNSMDYFITSDHWSASDGNFTEQEIYSMYSIPVGWLGYDSYGRYISCYGPYDDLYIYDFDINDASKAYIINGYKKVLISKEKLEDYNDYYESYNEDGKLYADISIEDLEGYKFNLLDDEDMIVMISPNQEKLAAAEARFNKSVDLKNKLTVKIIAASLVLLICVVYLIAVCGYCGENNQKWRYAVIFGRWHTEFLVIGMIMSLAFAGVILSEYSGWLRIIKNLFDIPRPYSYWCLGGAVTFISAAGLGFLLGAVSKLKVHSFWRDFYVFKLFKGFLRWSGEKLRSWGLFEKYSSQTVARKLYIRQWIFAGVTAAEALIIIMSYGVQHYSYEDDYDYYRSGLNSGLAVISIIAWIVYFIWFIITEFRIYRDINRLDIQIDQMSRGDEPDSDIPVTSPVYSDSIKLSEISKNIKDTVEKQVQSERMKIELVTNVSHDLKTPLTSIISYIDLLKSEDLPPEAMDYVKILEQKSEKLKNIVADVFSLAKATSGVDIDMEKLDAVILLNQALADAQDKIEKSGRQMKINTEAKSAIITADGNKLYRVFQNLIDNALNYSMDGTRIFIDFKEEKNYIRLEMKNTASYEMNFTPDEITERFTRGDKSRTDGGNGLGLSIAKTFTEACGGVFRIELDGDVFKAVLLFQKSTDSDGFVKTSE